jgi:hypothetical protein
MFERMKSGWRLAKMVRKSVSEDRNLYLFPIMTGILGVVIFAVTFLLLFIEIPVSLAPYSFYFYIIGMFIAYVAVYFVTTLILLGMLICYRSHWTDSPKGFRESLGIAWGYKSKAFEWALFYSVLIMILRAIESRFRGIGGIIIGAIGSLAITVATFFAIPAILDYKVGPIKAIEQSVLTIRKNFGATFGGIIYIDLYTTIFMLSGFFLLIVSVFLIGSALPLLLLLGIFAVSIILIILGLILNFTYLNVFKMILFDYLNGKGLPEGFDEATIRASFKRSRSSGFGTTGI